MAKRENPLPAPLDAVVFDLDGTLVDTAADLQAHVNAVLGEFGRPDWTSTMCG